MGARELKRKVEYRGVGKLQHVLHNALHSWVGPVGGYNSDSAYLSEGRYDIKDLKNLYEKLREVAAEIGVREIKGSVVVKDVCICVGRRHYRGKEYLIKLVGEGKVAFARVLVAYWGASQLLRIDIL